LAEGCLKRIESFRHYYRDCVTASAINLLGRKALGAEFFRLWQRPPRTVCNDLPLVSIIKPSLKTHTDISV
jgi:hypothetical protein